MAEDASTSISKAIHLEKFDGVHGFKVVLRLAILWFYGFAHNYVLCFSTCGECFGQVFTLILRFSRLRGAYLDSVAQLRGGVFRILVFVSFSRVKYSQI